MNLRVIGMRPIGCRAVRRRSNPRIGVGMQPAELDARRRLRGAAGPRSKVCSVNRPSCFLRLSGRYFSSPRMLRVWSRYWTPLVPPQPPRSDWTTSARTSPPLMKKREPISPVVLDLVMVIFGDAAAELEPA